MSLHDFDLGHGNNFHTISHAFQTFKLHLRELDRKFLHVLLVCIDLRPSHLAVRFDLKPYSCRVTWEIVRYNLSVTEILDALEISVPVGVYVISPGEVAIDFLDHRPVCSGVRSCTGQIKTNPPRHVVLPLAVELVC